MVLFILYLKTYELSHIAQLIGHEFGVAPYPDLMGAKQAPNKPKCHNHFKMVIVLFAFESYGSYICDFLQVTYFVDLFGIYIIINVYIKSCNNQSIKMFNVTLLQFPNYSEIFNIEYVQIIIKYTIKSFMTEIWNIFIEFIIRKEKNWNVNKIMDEIIDQMEFCVLIITGKMSSSNFYE